MHSHHLQQAKWGDMRRGAVVNPKGLCERSRLSIMAWLRIKLCKNSRGVQSVVRLSDAAVSRNFTRQTGELCAMNPRSSDNFVNSTGRLSDKCKK
jgi:hypothetical protein